MITRVEIKNYKCLADVSVDLTPVHAVVGPNDSGKTSFLEAVAAFVNLRSLKAAAFPSAWEGAELVWGHAPDRVVCLKGVFASPLMLRDRGHPDYSVTQEITFGDQDRSLTVKVDHAPARSSGPGIGMVEHLLSQLGPAILLQLVPGELAQPAGVDPDRPFDMHPSGHGLVTLLDDILGDDRNGFIALEEEFCRLFPRYSRLVLKRARAGIKHEVGKGLVQYTHVGGKELWLVIKDDGMEIRASQLSDGILIAIMYLALKHLPHPPSVILVEEPENSIHPKRLEEVVRILREVTVGTGDVAAPQVILASHSPYLLDYLKPEEVTAFTRREDGAVETIRLSDVEDIENRTKYFMLGEFLYMEGEEKLAKETRSHEGAVGGRREE